jgi:hypothetical protein
MFAGLRRQVRSGRSERLNARLLVIGDDRHRIARLLFRSGRGGLNKPYLAVDAQNLRHLLFELRVVSFQVIAHLVWLYLLPIEYGAQRALGQFGKAAVPLCRSLLARIAGEESFVPIRRSSSRSLPARTSAWTRRTPPVRRPPFGGQAEQCIAAGI